MDPNLRHSTGDGKLPVRASSGDSAVSPSPARPGTPSSDAGLNPFSDGLEFRYSHQNNGESNPFGSPEASRPASSLGSQSGLGLHSLMRTQRYFHSRRIEKGSVEKPWVEKPDPKEKWVTILPIIGIVLGICVSGLFVWDGINSVAKHKYCPQLDITDFSAGLDPNIWTREVNMGGFGNGEFEMTTSSDKNILIENGNLILRATPQDAALANKTARIDLVHNEADIARFGKCTSTLLVDCFAATNVTVGNTTIVPPAVSARINTKNAKGKLGQIKYGRVEVTAKLPAGQWLWPAIWMLPVNDTFGPWPQSGEIDIMESRGNSWQYLQGGSDITSSALHWGPNPENDGWWVTNNKRQALHASYADQFNTFGVEWSQKYIFTYVNSRLLQVLYTSFSQSLWHRVSFPAFSPNGTKIEDPWLNDPNANAPFDQPFYLIISLAVGGTNGWFQDGSDGKPWIDTSPSAPKDFWKAQSQWLPTWTQPQIEISKVAMWQQCDGNEDL